MGNWDWINFFEVLSFIFAIFLLILLLLQSKKSQSGLLVLSGGSQQLFSTTKTFGLEKILSIITIILGMLIFIFSVIIILLGG